MIKSSLTLLNIDYDPEYPFDHPQQEIDDSPEPWFPYRRGGVKVLGLEFVRTRVNTGGFDPYAGDRWTCTVLDRPCGAPLLTIVASDVIALHFEIEVSPLALIDVLYVAYGMPFFWPRIDADFRGRSYKLLNWYEGFDSKVPLPMRWLWNFLDYRWEWFSTHDDSQDLGLSYYE